MYCMSYEGDEEGHNQTEVLRTCVATQADHVMGLVWLSFHQWMENWANSLTVMH